MALLFIDKPSRALGAVPICGHDALMMRRLDRFSVYSRVRKNNFEGNGNNSTWFLVSVK
jgi:hypothetical protein